MDSPSATPAHWRAIDESTRGSGPTNARMPIARRRLRAEPRSRATKTTTLEPSKKLPRLLRLLWHLGRRS